PNLNAFAERWIQTCRQECLDCFIIYGEVHLRHLLNQCVTSYNESRPHQSLGNRPLSGADPPGQDICTAADIICEEHVGGLLKHYRRAAAYRLPPTELTFPLPFHQVRCARFSANAQNDLLASIRCHGTFVRSRCESKSVDVRIFRAPEFLYTTEQAN